MYAAQLIRNCRRLARHDWTLTRRYSKLEIFVDTDTTATNKKTRHAPPKIRQCVAALGSWVISLGPDGVCR
jgi:hypothetical protein